MTVPSPPVTFPCRQIPGDGRQARLIGLYPQPQHGLWMQRIKVLGGRLTAGEWRGLADVARRFTPATALHLTTRQDVELHDLPAECVAAAQQALDRTGLTGLGACGDTVRNITVCPCSGVATGTVDLWPLAWRVRRTLEAADGAFSLPRKFKISISACQEACGRPFLNDVGLVARRDGGEWVFDVFAAGSLGPRPATAVRLDPVRPADVPPLVLSLMRLFAAHGDRKHRSTARLRHVRERMGNEAFGRAVREAFSAAQAERSWPQVQLPPAPPGATSRIDLTFADGNLSAEAAEAIASLADRPDLRVRIDPCHKVVVWGPDPSVLERAVATLPVLADALRPQPTVVACPGRRWCARGIVDTAPLAAKVRALPPGTVPPAAAVCISGCPNSCAHSAVAEIGLIGGRSQGKEVFSLLVGGGMGRDDRLARVVACGLTADEAVARIASLAAQGTRP